MTHSRSRLTEFIFIRTISQIPPKRWMPNCITETSSSASQRHHMRNSSTPLSRTQWRRFQLNGAWPRIGSRMNLIICSISVLKHILASKLTYLIRGIPPGFAQPLADCLTPLHRETCEILTQCETIPDISFDLVRIQEGAARIHGRPSWLRLRRLKDRLPSQHRTS